MSVKKIVSLLLLIVLVCSSIAVFAGCEDVPSNYTLEQHKERIAKFVERRYFNTQYRNYTGYTLYPLYNANDELYAFLIEFEPYGFTFIGMFPTKRIPIIGNRMYYESDEIYTWQRFRFSIDGNDPEPYEGCQWLAKQPEYRYNPDIRYETNNEGQFIEYSHSPYSVADVLNEKKYFLEVYHGSHVTAIKRGDKLVNLVSMEEFTYGTEEWYFNEKNENIPTLSTSFHGL